MNNTQPKSNYDVVIIGGGISGLTSSALFSRSGLSCCLIEMDARPGGYMAGFDRQDFRFDSAIHWLNNCGPNGWVSKIFSFIGPDYPKSKVQKHIRRFISDDFNYLVSHNPDELKEQWISEFPQDKKGIMRFFRDAQRIAKSFDHYHNLSRSMDTMHLLEKAIYGLKILKFALPFIPHIRYSGEEGVQRGLKKYFSNEKLRRVFSSEPDLLSCLIPISWAYSNNFQTPPSGGSQRFPEWLKFATEHMGGALFLGSKVTEVIVENRVAKGVKFENKNGTFEVKSKYVIAACDAETLFDKLLPQSIVPDKIKVNLQNAELYASAFTVSIALDCPAEALGLGEENIYLADSTEQREALGKGDPFTSGIHILASSVRDQSLAPKNAGTLTLFIPAWIENNNFWACQKDENGQWVRGEAYKQLKEKYAQILIDRVQEKVIPELRKHILFFDVATPITLQRYTGNKNGSMMGQRPGKKNMKAKVASYKTPVKNLYLSGHWADLGGGILIAMKSAVNTSLIVLQKENKAVFRLFADYIDGKKSLKSIENSNLLRTYTNVWKQELTPAQKKENNTHCVSK